MPYSFVSAFFVGVASTIVSRVPGGVASVLSNEPVNVCDGLGIVVEDPDFDGGPTGIEAFSVFTKLV